MSFTDAVRATLNNYANFSGRSRRAEYWYFSLFILLAYAAIMLLTAVRPWFGIALTFVFLIAMVIPGMAVNIRRLHDTDRSGWWVLIGFVPLLGAVMLLIWHCTPGTVGPNRFGADPKAA